MVNQATLREAGISNSAHSNKIANAVRIEGRPISRVHTFVNSGLEVDLDLRLFRFKKGLLPTDLVSFHSL
jgi:hypothetical protein